MVPDDRREKIALAWLWALPAALPLFLILLSYVFVPWSWGLMDDLQLLSFPGGIVQRAKDIFMMYFAFGECKWTHALHCAVFYKVFADAPGVFHIFKWGEIAVMLGIWGAAAHQLTGRPSAFFLVGSMALSFHYLYDQFFFLSTHETTGLIFLGLALLCAAKAFFGPGGTARPPSGRLLAGAAVSFLAALGAKETFVACGMALGLSIAALHWVRRPAQAKYLWIGFGLAVFSLMYGLILKNFVASAYTAHYSFFNLPRILEGLKDWALKDLTNHVPWLAAAVLIWWKADKKNFRYMPAEQWGIAAGVLLYGLFLLVLLPWNTKSYYAGPFGVFFAFTAAVFIASLLPRVRTPWNIMLASAAIILNVFVCQYALVREQTYHQNTQDLWQWIRGNPSFQKAAQSDAVGCNAREAADAITGHAQRHWKLDIKNFRYQPERNFPADMHYLVYSPRFGPASFAEPGWNTVFFSRYWQVYQRRAP